MDANKLENVLFICKYFNSEQKIIQKAVDKSFWVKGNQVNVSFWVGLPKMLISRTLGK